jgi:protocatechuate 3,4-dioxygenase alpha subunit
MFPGAVPAGATPVGGRLFDGSGAPVTDALVEFWQADENGCFPPDSGAGWRGFTRSLTDPAGAWELLTVKPGRVPTAAGVLQAPHIDVSIFARGLLQRLVTRIYFADEIEANENDPVLADVGPERALTLVAVPAGGGYSLDIRLQGEGETVFFVP